MNTRPPNTDMPDPLDNDEAALARIVHALPAGDPPSALDVRILKAASDALATTSKRRTAWLSSAGSLWGIGSAAAAVLAVGITWQRMNPPLPSLPSSSPAPVAEDSRDDDRLRVEFKQEPPRNYQYPPPPAEPAAPALVDRAASKPRADQPAPGALPHDVLDEHVAQGGREAPAAKKAAPVMQAAPVLGELSGSATDTVSAAPAPRVEAQAASAEVASAGAMANAVTAERDQAEKENTVDVARRVAPDARLYPESWLLKIRTRLKGGDVEGARASLRQFVAKYPQQTVPDDLKALLPK